MGEPTSTVQNAHCTDVRDSDYHYQTQAMESGTSVVVCTNESKNSEDYLNLIMSRNFSFLA